MKTAPKEERNAKKQCRKLLETLSSMKLNERRFFICDESIGKQYTLCVCASESVYKNVLTSNTLNRDFSNGLFMYFEFPKLKNNNKKQRAEMSMNLHWSFI